MKPSNITKLMASDNIFLSIKSLSKAMKDKKRKDFNLNPYDFIEFARINNYKLKHQFTLEEKIKINENRSFELLENMSIEQMIRSMDTLTIPSEEVGEDDAKDKQQQKAVREFKKRESKKKNSQNTERRKDKTKNRVRAPFQEVTISDLDYNNQKLRTNIRIKKGLEKPRVDTRSKPHPRKFRAVKQSDRLTKRDKQLFRLEITERKKKKKADRLQRRLEHARDSDTFIVTESADFDMYSVFLKMRDTMSPPDVEFVDSIRETISNYLRTTKSTAGNFTEFIYDNADICRLTTSTVVFIYQLVRNNDKKDYALSLIQFGIANRDFIPEMDFAAIAASFLESIGDTALSIQMEPGVKTESLLDTYQGFLSFLNVTINSTFVTAIRNLVLCIAGAKWFSKETASKLHRYLGKSTTMPVIDIIQTVLGDVGKLLGIGDAISRGVPLTTALISDDPIASTLRAAQLLLDGAECVYTGLPIPGYICETVYVTEMTQHLEFLSVIKKEMSTRSPYYDAVIRMILKLTVAITGRMSIVLGRTRHTPYGIILHGLPGAGKSKVLLHIAFLWSRVKGREFDMSHIYSRCKTTDYWEGYIPMSHRVIHYSEVGAIHKNLAGTRGDAMIDEIISVCGDLPFPCDMAFEGKGKTFATPELVLIDTNTPGLNLEVLVNVKTAVQRRFLYIHQQVKPQFKKDGANSIDYTKSVSADDNLLDRWTFEVYTLDPVDNSKAEKKIFLTHSNSDIYKLSELLVDLFERHVADQESFQKTFEGNKEFARYLPSACEEKNETVTEALDVVKKDKVECNWFTILYMRFLSCMCKASIVTESFAPSRITPHVVEYGHCVKERMCGYGRFTYDLSAFMIRNNRLVLLLGCLLSVLALDLGVNAYRCAKLIYPRSFMLNLASFGREQRLKTGALGYLIPLVSVTGLLSVGVLPAWLAFPLLFLTQAVYPVHFVIRYYSFYTIGIWWFILFIVLSALECTVPWVIRKGGDLYLKQLRSHLKRQITKNYVMLRNFVYLPKGTNPCVGGEYKKEILAIATITFGISILATYLRLRKKTKPGTEAHTVFKSPTIVDEEINEFENSFHCGGSYKRIPNAHHQIWNVQQVGPKVCHTGSMADLGSSLAKNIRLAKVCGLTTTRTYVFGLMENYAIINTHALGKFVDHVDIYVSCSGEVNDDLNEHWRVSQVRQCDMAKISADLTVVRLTGIKFANKLKHIAENQIYEGSCRGLMMGKPVRAKFKDQSLIMHNRQLGNISLRSYWEYELDDHAPGICGLPLIAEMGAGSCVVGFHCAGDTRNKLAFSEPIDRNAVIDGIERCRLSSPFMQVVSEGAIDYSNLGPPIPKSPFVHEKLQGLAYYGKTPGPVLVKGKSSLVPTPYRKAFRELFEVNLGFTPTVHFCPPLMGPVVRKGGDYVSPYNIGLRNMSVTKKPLNADVLSIVIKRFTRHILDGLMDVPSLQPLTIENAINGPEIDPFIRRVNASTSGGWGYDGSKSSHIPIVDTQNNRVIREPEPFLREKILQILKRYEQEETNNFVFQAQLKDEPREVAKAVQGKTRIFFMTPLDALITTRMFLAPFYSLMVERNNLFCTSVGINMHVGADQFVRELVEFSPLLMEGDYSKYDQTMPFEIGMAACSVIYNVLESKGYTKSALTTLRGILTDNMFPFVNMNLDLFEKPALQPSGKYGTAEDNSLRNVVMLMYAWYINPVLADKDFFDYILPRTYGDDLAAAVKPQVSRHFNNNYYKRICDEEFGMMYTSATKSDTLEDFLTIEDLSFLKRRFVFSERFNRWLAPLDMNSLLRSVTWVMPSKVVSSEKQNTDTCVSLIWELVFHLDEPLHDVFRSNTISILADLYGRDFAELHKIVPSYQFIVHALKFDTVQTESIGYYFAPDVGQGVETALDLSAEGYLASHWNCCRVTPNKKFLPTGGSNLCVESGALIHKHADIIIDTPVAIDPMVISHMKMANLQDLYDQRARLEDHLVKARNELNPNLFPGRSLRTLNRSVFLRSRQSNSRALKEHMRLMRVIEDVVATLNVLDRHIQRVMYVDSIITESEELTGLAKSGAIATSVEDKMGNLTDIAGDVPDKEDAGESRNLETGQRHLLSMDDFFSRPIPITSFQMAVGAVTSLHLDVWNLFTLNPTVRAKLRNYAYLRGDLNVRITVSGTPFHSGRLMVSYQPQPLRNYTLLQHMANLSLDPNYRPLMLNYLSQAPGSRVINVHDNLPVDITCPYVGNQAMFRLMNNSALAISDTTPYEDLETCGDLVIYTLNPVTAISTSPSDISVFVYAWMTNVELGTSTATQVGIVTESADERKTGPIENISSRAAEVAKALTTVPYIAPFATASHIALGALSRVSAIFGWSKPILTNLPSLVKNMPFQNGCVTVGCDTNYKLTLDPHQELTVDPRVLGSGEDEMTINYIAGIKTYLTTFTWADDSPVMSFPLFECGVTPMLHTTYSLLGTTYAQPTALAFAATPFLYWRGTITFTVEVVCSLFHRGKYAIYFEPNTWQHSLINLDIDTNKQYMKVVDIQETQEVDFCVNWAFPRAWATSIAQSNFDDIYKDTTLMSALSESLNGYIGIVPLTTLQSPDDSDISVNIYVRSDDLQVNQMAFINMPSVRDVITESEDLSTNEVTCIDLNDSSAIDSNVALEHFGERPVSFRQLLKRYVATHSVDHDAFVGLLVQRVWFPNIPTIKAAYGGPSTLQQDLFNYLRYAYVGVRGGVRKRLRFFNTGMDNINAQVKITMREPTSSTLPAPQTAAIVLGNTLRGTVTFSPHTNAGIEFELPFYTNNLFVYSFADDLISFSGTSGMETLWSRQYEVSFDAYDLSAGTIVEETAAAEDFSFLRYQGAPYFSF